MKLAIVGSRNFVDYQKFKNFVEAALETWGTPEQIISGGATGADTLARRFAKD